MPFKHNGWFGNHWEWEEPVRPSQREFYNLPAYYLDVLWFPRNSGLVLQATRLVGYWTKTLLLVLSLLAVALILRLFTMIMDDDKDGPNPLFSANWSNLVLYFTSTAPATRAPSAEPYFAAPAPAPVVVDEWPELTAKEATMGRPRQYPPPPEPKPYSPNQRPSPDFSVARQDFFKHNRRMTYFECIREERLAIPSWHRRDQRRDDTPEHVKQAANLQYNMMCVSVAIEHRNANSFGVGPYLSPEGMKNLEPIAQYQRCQAIQQAAQSLQQQPRVAFLGPYQQRQYQQQFGASNQVFVSYQNRPELLNHLKSFGKEIRDLLPQIHFAIENCAWMTQSATTADLTRDYLCPALHILGRLSPGIRKQEITTLYWPMQHLRSFQAWLSVLGHPDAVDTETMRVLGQLLAVFSNAQQEAGFSIKGAANGFCQSDIGSQTSQQPQSQQWQQQQQGPGYGGISTGTPPVQQPPAQIGGCGGSPPNNPGSPSTPSNVPNRSNSIGIGTLTPIRKEDEPASPSSMPADKREFLTILIRDIYGEIKTLRFEDNDSVLHVGAGRALEGRCAKAVKPLLERAYTVVSGKPWSVSKVEAGEFGEWCVGLYKAMLSRAYRGPLKRKYSQEVKEELEQVGKALNLGFGPSDV
ncbi:hypothetical protein BCR34DRAFT_53333 [Clohesyomyces aquaticus]|uniref:Uncharacterized protein n=1 Tax=Clohesyomyces aquaticus TaxID=1231657 RepID=A0A1Y1Z3W5_9PLEO|nr:hypothetical protein BCR34DRAFT_53333 [Clohesyomyces aquaticus]